MKNGNISSFASFKMLLMGCAMGSGAFISLGQYQAYAASSMSLQPVSGWAVSRVGDVSTNDGYCALARRFSNSHVVTIAQNKQREASFAFDFQRPDFKTNRSYNIELSVGDYHQSYDIMAKSETGIVVKVGRNQALFDALESAQKLMLSVDGRNYNFMFSGFHSGHEQLEQCLGFTVERVKEQYSNRMGQLKGQMSELRDELGMLRSENQSLLTQMDGERSKYKNQIAQKTKENAQIDALMVKLSNLENNNMSLSQKLKSEQSTNTQMQSELNALIAQKESIKSNADEGLKAALEQARREREAIEQKYSSNVGQLKGQMSELRDGLGQLQSENKTLLAQLENERQKFRSDIAQKTKNNAQIDDLMGKLTALENNNTNLMQKLQNEQSANVGLQSNLDKLIAENKLVKGNADAGVKAAVVAAQKERDELRAMLDSEKARRAEIEKIVAQKDNIEKQQSELVSRISELERMNVDLGLMLDKEESERKKMENKLKQTASNKDDYDKILNENKALRENLEAERQAGKSSHRVDELSEKLAMQESLVSQKDKEAEAARQSLFETKARLEKSQNERDNLMKMLERERSEFSSYMRQEGGKDTDAVKMLSEKLATLEDNNAVLMRSLQEKEEQLAIRGSDASGDSARAVALQNRQVNATEQEIAELKQMLAMERDERMRLARMMADGKEGTNGTNIDSNAAPTRAAFDELANSFQQRIAKMEQENNRLRTQLNDAGKQSSGAIVSSVSQKELHEAQMMIAQKKQELDTVSAERDELKNLLGQEKARRMKMAKMLAQKKEVTTQKTELNGHLRALEARNIELSRALEQAKKDAVSSRMGVRNIGKVVARPPITASSSSSSNHEIAQIKNDLEIALAERDEYRKLLQEERARLKEVQSLRARIGSVRDDQNSLNDTIESLRKEKIELQRSLETARNNASTAGGVNDDREELDVLRAERDALRDQILHGNKGSKKDMGLLQTMVNKAQKDENELHSRVAKLEQEKQELNSLLSKAQREAEKARNDVSRYAADNTNMNAGKLQNASSGNDNQRIVALEEENRRLYAEMKALKAQKSEVETLEGELSSVKAQNSILKDEIQDRKKDASKVVADEDMVAHLRGTIERLSMQNENLEEALNFAKQRESQIGDENPYRKKLLNAETRIQAVMAENASLSRELEKVRTDSEKSLVSSEDTDMNMELAQARYKEAEREIDRLSQILKDERSKHQQEVAELEDKLFDPAITETEQLKKLQAMKQEIAHLQRLAPAANNGSIDKAYKGGASVNPVSLADAPSMIQTGQSKNADAKEYPKSGAYIKIENSAATSLEPINVAEVQAVKPDIDKNMSSAASNTAPSMKTAQAEDKSDGYKSSVSRLRERLARNSANEDMSASYATSRYYNKDTSTQQPKDTKDNVVAKRDMPTVNSSHAVDFQPVPQAAVPTQSQTSVASIEQAPDVSHAEPAAGINMGQAVSSDPVVMNMQRLPQKGETIKEMAPVMDGPGEAQLASAIQNGGGVFVSEHQVVVQPQQPSLRPAPAQTAVSRQQDISAQMAGVTAQPRVVYQMQPIAEPSKVAQVPASQAQMQMAMANTIAQPIPQMPAAAQPRNLGPDGQDIASLLVNAGVPMVSGFEKVNSVSNDRFAAFRWDTGSVYGSAEKTYMPDMSQFQNFVDGYLRKTEARCTGSFDKTSYGMRHIAGRSWIAYDIACVGGDMQGAGAALLFYAENNTFNVIAHESGIEGFDTAMNTRDTLISALSR